MACSAVMGMAVEREQSFGWGEAQLLAELPAKPAHLLQAQLLVQLPGKPAHLLQVQAN